MKLLLDTHIWVWAVAEPAKLAPTVTKAIANRANEVWLSPVSVWEVLLLIKKNRLSTGGSADMWVSKALQAAPFLEATFTNEVALAVAQIQLPHRDPTDHFLVATAKVYGLTFVTSDKNILASKQISVLAN